MQTENKIFSIFLIANLWLVAFSIAWGMIKTNDQYNEGYRQGMLYAYDEVVVCGASPEERGLELARMMGVDNLSSNECEE